MKSFLTNNWKALIPAALAVATAGFTYIHELDARFDTQDNIIAEVQTENRVARDSMNYRLKNVEDDVSDIRCIAIRTAQGGDPLDCIE